MDLIQITATLQKFTGAELTGTLARIEAELRGVNANECAFVLSTVGVSVNLTRADSSRVREAGADTPSSVSRPTRAQRPARAGWAALRQFRLSDIPLWGERWSSGVRGERWWRRRGVAFLPGSNAEEWAEHSEDVIKFVVMKPVSCPPQSSPKRPV
jgi:hypothetical protein